MNVGDIMTQEVISVSPSTSVAEAARLMLSQRVSGLPVLNADRILVGIVTEGDFLRRAEAGTEKSRPHWMEFFVGANVLASEFVRSHARTVSDVMTRDVVVATEDMPLAKAVELMERGRVKRLPVVRDGHIVGIIARANLLRVLAAGPAQAAQPGKDRDIREQIERELNAHPWHGQQMQVVVKDGIVDLWGLVTGDQQRNAMRVAAENVPGVKQVRNHLMWFERNTGFIIDTGEPAPTVRH